MNTIKRSISPFILILLLICCTPKKRKIKTPENTSRTIDLTITDNKNIIGFACYAGGHPTDIVENYETLLKSKNYHKAIAKLYSSSAEHRFLAMVICNYLSEKKRIILSSLDLKQIQMIGHSNDSISTCSGCSNDEKYAVKDLLGKQDIFFMQQANDWLENTVKD